MSTQLDALPLEILFHILSYTELTYDPTPTTYPLCTMAATNKYLNTVVEEYAFGLLKQHTKTTGRKASNNTWRRKWLAQICGYCKKKSQRKATLYPALTCCRACDRENFPKMTMTVAKDTSLLSKLDLFTPNILHSDLPRLAAGSCHINGSYAVMILEADVLARREHIYELLGSKVQDSGYMRRRIRSHEHLTMYLGLRFDIFNCKWTMTQSPPAFHSGPKSLRTKESRDEYVRKALEMERAALGQDAPA